MIGPNFLNQNAYNRSDGDDDDNGDGDSDGDGSDDGDGDGDGRPIIAFQHRPTLEETVNNDRAGFKV